MAAGVGTSGRTCVGQNAGGAPGGRGGAWEPAQRRVRAWGASPSRRGGTNAAGAYPTWDADSCRGLLQTFGLDPEKRLAGLSRGMTAKVALTLALAHRPRLLVLDEATSGLDAAVRQEFLETMVGVAADAGRTVLISTHLLNEVERVVDHAAFIDRGRLRFVEDIESLRERFREIRLTFADEAPAALELPGVVQATRLGREWVAVIDDASEARFREIRARFPQAECAGRVLSLQGIFVALQRTAAAGGG